MPWYDSWHANATDRVLLRVRMVQVLANSGTHSTVMGSVALTLLKSISRPMLIVKVGGIGHPQHLAFCHALQFYMMDVT